MGMSGDCLSIWRLTNMMLCCCFFKLSMCKILITSREGTEREPYWGFALPPVWLRHNANQGLFLEKQTGSHGNDHVAHPHPYHFLNHRESYDTLTALRPPPLSRPTPPIICSMWNVDGMLVRQEGSKTPSGRGGAAPDSLPFPPSSNHSPPPLPFLFFKPQNVGMFPPPPPPSRQVFMAHHRL